MMSNEERIARLEHADETNGTTFERIEAQHVATSEQLAGISRHLAHQEGQFTGMVEDLRVIKTSTAHVEKATNGGVKGAAQRAAMPVAGGAGAITLWQIAQALGISIGGG